MHTSGSGGAVVTGAGRGLGRPIAALLVDKPRPVTTLPRSRGVQARLAALAPRVAVAAAPLVVARGRRTQKRMLRDR